MAALLAREIGVEKVVDLTTSRLHRAVEVVMMVLRSGSGTRNKVMDGFGLNLWDSPGQSTFGVVPGIL